MTKLLLVLLALVLMLASLLNFPEGAVASALSIPVGLIGAMLLLKLTDDSDNKQYVLNIFVAAVVFRILYGTIAYVLDFWLYFAGDAETYNQFGIALAEYLVGTRSFLSPSEYSRLFSFTGSGWGMYYIVASIYMLVGQNPMAGNMVCSVIAAAAAPITFLLSKELVPNQRVAKLTALLVALFPGFINWSSFMMKDGILVMLLTLSLLLTTRLQKRFSIPNVLGLLFSLIGIISLRFYIFPMIMTAIVGGFLIGEKNENSTASALRRAVVIVLIGIALTYSGLFLAVQDGVDRYGSLKSLNNARLDQSTTGASGFETADVSTTEGAIAYLPTGLIYLLLAPFPWQITSLRAALTMPEMVVWWLSMPFLVIGVIYSFRNRLRAILPVLIFTLMLTVGYAIFQGNIGTAYRQRIQIQVFYFLFISVGVVVTLEKRENKKLLAHAKRQRLQKPLAEIN